jgi:hypothetical protein
VKLLVEAGTVYLYVVAGPLADWADRPPICTLDAVELFQAPCYLHEGSVIKLLEHRALDVLQDHVIVLHEAPGCVKVEGTGAKKSINGIEHLVLLSGVLELGVGVHPQNQLAPPCFQEIVLVVCPVPDDAVT